MTHPRCIIAFCVFLLTLASLAAADLVTQDNATGKIYCRSPRFLVPYEAADNGPSGISAVRLYYTTDDGKTWAVFGEKPDPKGSFEFIAPSDGVYGFTVEAVDKAGNVERKDHPLQGTKPEISVVVDTKPPQIDPIFPHEDLELAPGAHMRIRFRAADPNISPSTAAVSVKKDDMAAWVPLPNVTFQDDEFFVQGDILYPGKYSVKLSIGDRADNSAETAFSFTCTPNARPPVHAPGPLTQEWLVPISAPPRARSLILDIDYSVQDIGGQPPAAVGLWYTTDAGNTWQFYGVDPDVKSPFNFQAPGQGIYGFKITATSRAGISEPAPKPGVKPDMSTLVDTMYPSLLPEDPRGGESYAGGEVHYIEWTARDDHFGSLPISLYTARDGGEWQLLAADLPNTGTYGWNVPRIDYAVYRLKIEARDQVGNTTTVTSDNFYVVSAPPESRVKAIISASPLVGTANVRGSGADAETTPKPGPETPPAKEEPAPPPTATTDTAVKELIDKATGMRLRGDYEGAEAALRNALKKDSSSVYARCELGGLLIQQGRYSDAIETLNQARQLDAKDTDVLYNLASAYYALGQYDNAAAIGETFVALDPKNEAALWNLSKAYYAADKITKARLTWQQIVVLDVPGSPFAERANQALAAVPDTEPKK